jgi:hypothetical protein
MANCRVLSDLDIMSEEKQVEMSIVSTFRRKKFTAIRLWHAPRAEMEDEEVSASSW